MTSLKALQVGAFAVGAAAVLLSGPVLLSAFLEVPAAPPDDPVLPARFVLGRLALCAFLVGIGVGMVRTSMEGRIFSGPSGLPERTRDPEGRRTLAWTGVGMAGGIAVFIGSAFVVPSVHPAFAAAFVAFPLFAGGMRGSRRRTAFAIAALFLSAFAAALAADGIMHGTVAARPSAIAFLRAFPGPADAIPARAWLALLSVGSAVVAVAGIALGLRRVG